MYPSNQWVLQCFWYDYTVMVDWMNSFRFKTFIPYLETSHILIVMQILPWISVCCLVHRNVVHIERIGKNTSFFFCYLWIIEGWCDCHCIHIIISLVGVAQSAQCIWFIIIGSLDIFNCRIVLFDDEFPSIDSIVVTTLW